MRRGPGAAGASGQPPHILRGLGGQPWLVRKEWKTQQDKAQRALGRLRRDKLIKKDRGRYEITEQGRKTVKQKGTD